MYKRLTKSYDRMLAGVYGGILLYILLCFIMPKSEF